ncbi:MAG: SUMF1/EgtB/PvdO family nonheme iron enzyme [Caldilineaceae bacterium]
MRPKLRHWADLGVGEAELGRIVESIQRTLDQRWAAEQASRRTFETDKLVQPQVDDEIADESADDEWYEEFGDDELIEVASDDTVDVDFSPRIIGEATEETWPLEAHHAAGIQPRFVLLGDPGSGKSSFLRHLTLCLAGELRQRAKQPGVPANANLAALGDWLLDADTPIYIEMRSLVRDAFPPLPADAHQPAARPTAETLWRYLYDTLPAGDLADFVRDLRALADEGKAILLLDGLDEVPQADDPRRRDQVKALIAALVQDTPELRIIVGSRPYAYHAGEWVLAGFGHTTLLPLRMARLQELAKALFTAADITPPAPQSGTRSPARGGSHDAADVTSVPPPIRGRLGGGDPDHLAETFVQALEAHPHLDERLHANPLFFTLLAALWLADTERRLPATQAELYRAAVDLLLERWTRRRAPDLSVVENLGLTPAELRSVLETFACTVQEGAEPGGDTTLFRIGGLLDVLYEAGYNPRVQDISTYLERHAGLLVSPSRNVFYFSHRSFQEHLAACELTCREPAKRRPPPAPDRHFPDGLIRRVHEAPALWRNVAYLAADELMTQGRDGEGLLWQVLDEFCQPYLTVQRAPAAVAIALGIARHHDLFDLRNTDRRYRRDLEPLRQVALQVLTDVDHFTPAERNLAGELLGRHPEHDTRQGVGRRRDGLPAIDWVTIPESDGQGRREFIYQEDERRTEPTFWIARYPLTYSQFQAFLDADDGFHHPQWWAGLAAPAEGRAAPGEQYFKFWNHPRERVSWYDAMAFCRWLTAQAQVRPDLLPPALQGQTNWRITLPTEWQWEKAARGHDGRQYPWGTEYQVGIANTDDRQKEGTNYIQKTSAVCMYPHGASPNGVLDMSGNVWEFCLNEYDDPNRTQAEGAAHRVVRGGAWSSYSFYASALARGLCRRDGDDGFRVVVVFVVPVL